MAAPVSASATAIEPGHEVGPYVLTREIGKGSFAVVFQGKVQPAGDEKSADDGQQTNTPSQTASTSASAMQRPASTSVSRVAIKIVTRKKLTPKLLENLEGEISILRTVRHANIVELLDCLKTNSHIYLVMQYCRMGDLSNFIRTRRRTAESPSTAAAASTSTKDAGQSSTNARSKSLFEEDMDKQYPHPHDGGLHSEMVRSFLAQLASALQFMRSKNIVHRDIKPQNLLLQEPEGSTIRAGHPALIPQLKVADFGFARHLEAASLAETLCGSPLYMAPEILRYEKYDAKADLWSVGAVLYEMCVGKPPFRASNHVELLRRIERGEDKIRFPDERSDDSLKREQVRKASDGGSGKDVSKPVRPHEVDGDIKQLIRALLRRRPIERMSFEDFFFCEVLQEYKQRTTSPSPLHGSGDQFDTASISLTPSPASSNVMPVVAKRIAPAIPSTQAHRPSAKTDLAHSNELTQAHGNPETDTSSAPTVGAAAAFAIPRYFTSKYVVGGHRSPEKQEEGNKDEQSPCARTTPLGKDTANRINRTSAARDNHEGEASSLEDNVLETPGSSVTHLPSTAHQDLPQTTSPTSGDSMREKRASAVYDDDRGYVLVDKRNLDVNAAAEEIMNNKAKGRLGAGAGGWSPLGVVRRPSQLGRLASLSGAINPLSSGGANTPPLPVQQTSTPPPLPSPRRFSTSGPATATAIPTTTTSTKTTTATKSSPSSASPSSIAKSSSPSHPRLGSTPPNAAFALPPNARKPSFSRRTSNTSDYARPIITRPPMSPLAPAPTAIQAATTASASGMASTSAPVTSTMDSSALASLQPQPSSSALSRAISMASIRLFGVPTNLSMRGAGVRRSLRMGLGTTGTLLSSSPGQTATSETQTLAAVDVAEQNLLSLLHEYGQKSFVLSEFADARLSTFFAEGPHQNNFVDRRAASNSSLSSMTGALHRQPGVKSTGTGTTTVGGGANDKAMASAEKCDESAEKGTLSSPKPSEVAASEAYVLYVRSLSFLQRGMDAARDYLEARSLSSGTASRYANTLLSSTGGGVGTGGSLDVVEAMQWLRAKFADGVERAKFARAKSVEEMPESAQYIDKMIFEEALEVARRAAIDELANSRGGTDDVHASSTTSLSSWNGERCLLAYETACTMLQSLLDPPPEHSPSHMADGATIGPATKELSTSAIGTIEKFITSISKRMQSIQRKLEAQGNIATSLNN